MQEQLLTSRYPDAVVLVFCKAPIPGQVKTRLMTAISAEDAAEIHKRLTRETLVMLTDARLCAVQLWCSPDSQHEFFQACRFKYGLVLATQQGTDLGAKMADAFARAMHNYQSVLIVGCDCPSLAAIDIEQALVALQQGYDVVLAPAEDGGYTLIGLNQQQSALFADIDWGSAAVLSQSIAVINTLGLRYKPLAEQWDVDHPADLSRYYASYP